MFFSEIQTPVGILTISADNDFIYSVSCSEERQKGLNPSELTQLAASQLMEYFDGKRTSFDFPIQQKGTDFQQRVWKELLNITPGYPISYAALSKRMGNPLAIRAIAAANGKNKLMIVIPCHRVIGSSGELVGYAGGLWRKKWLLEHEARILNLGQGSLFS